VIGRTKLSTSHQLTIPRGPFDASGFQVGDGLRIEVETEGRVVVTRASDHVPIQQKSEAGRARTPRPH
jgi:bifunctional DNA-binding transcriptional regulator/antitoxin component of YhaV-PrlF toxin-antitoxin module